MKHKKCWLWLLLALLLAAATVISCKHNSPDSGDPSPGDGNGSVSGEPGDTPAEISRFPVELLSQMKIVYPEHADEEVAKAADSLKAAIKSVFGCDLTVTTDYIRQGSAVLCEFEYEILLGNTNRTDDDTYYQNMRSEDYGYTASPSGKKILVGGKNDAATVSAVSNFTYDVVLMKKGGEGMFFRSDLTFYRSGSYSVQSMTLNGTPIQNYTIVYPEKAGEFEAQLARRLSSRISLLTGYQLAYVSDAQAYADGYEILIGKTNRTGAAELMTSVPENMDGHVAGAGKFVALYGSGTQGHATAVSALIAELEGNISADGTVSLTVGAGKTVQPSENVSMMTYNVKVADQSSARDERVFEMLLRYLPDVVGLQEANPSWMSKLSDEFSDYYIFVGEGREGDGKGEYTPVLYAKARFELLESGTRWLTKTPESVSMLPGAQYLRIFTWALLKDRVTGETFLHLNTHLDTAGDNIRMEEVRMLFEFLEAYEEVPLILTGDMNCKYLSTPMKTIMGMGLKPTTDLVDELNALADIDWIMVTDDCISVSNCRICDEKINGAYSSDHFPVYAELTVFVPEGGIHHAFGEVLPEFDDKWLEAEKDKEGEKFGNLHRIP